MYVRYKYLFYQRHKRDNSLWLLTFMRCQYYFPSATKCAVEFFQLIAVHHKVFPDRLYTKRIEKILLAFSNKYSIYDTHDGKMHKSENAVFQWTVLYTFLLNSYLSTKFKCNIFQQTLKYVNVCFESIFITEFYIISYILEAHHKNLSCKSICIILVNINISHCCK